MCARPGQARQDCTSAYHSQDKGQCQDIDGTLPMHDTQQALVLEGWLSAFSGPFLYLILDTNKHMSNNIGKWIRMIEK